MSSITKSKSHVSSLMSAINPLANPRGAKKQCELCQNPAYLQCNRPTVIDLRMTCQAYSDTEHQQADWVGIHEKVCQLLIPIRTATLFHSLQADRDHHCAQILHRQEELIEISRAVAQKKLFEGKYQESLPAAQLSLRCAMDVYGSSAVQLVPAYLLLAEANVGLGSLAQAEEYLSQAEWTVMKTPECSQTVRHQLHRNLGRLYTATENLEGALLHFANDVYYASEEYGLDNIVTCGGYFLMANVFIKQEKMDIVSSLYTEVASTWHSHLTKLLETHTQGSMTLEHSFDEAQQAEADQMLRAMLKVQESSPKQAAAQNALVAHSLAMLWFLGGSPDKALEFGRKALQSSQLVSDHSLTEPIQSLLQLAAEKGPHPTNAS
ncbi:zinc finger MYND domain-containing protein 12 isoform X2 [Coregonus clupeaformis]|uniref:zinc finger MYND domain-containing protein 12 isoform X2 n=1 Tax=Coregonus clupeaformis TaxID=59861 RepID=UPI001BDF90DF|nr:zinc finger MYND domain-containing protein 12 isoform X2 [Coregonus clupeaformis]